MPVDRGYDDDMTERASELPPNGTPVAAVVPADAAAYPEALEDAADVIAARRALAEDAPSIPAEQAWAELGLADGS